MSTTDTIRAAFESAYLSANGFHTKAELANEWKEGMLSSHMFRAGWQAATEAAKAEPAEFKGWYCAHCQRGVDASEVTYHEQHTVCGRLITDDRPPAAKATGTAGELPPLPEAHDVKGPHGWLEYYTADQMRAYGQACAEAARSLAISQADYSRDMDELAQDFEPVANMDLLKAKLHIVGLRKRLKNAKAKAEAARQPAPVVEQLVSALNAMLTHMGMDEDEWNKPTFDQARAAIAAAEQKGPK